MIFGIKRYDLNILLIQNQEAEPLIQRSTTVRYWPKAGPSSLGLLGNLERVIDLDSKVANGAFELAVAQQ